MLPLRLAPLSALLIKKEDEEEPKVFTSDTATLFGVL